VLRINDLAREMYGLRAGVVESVWDQVFDERLFKTTAALLADMVSRQALTGTGVVSSDAGREYLVQWRAVGPTLERVTFSAMDITAQRVAAEALAEQVRSRDQFIASVSHELRTPLTGGLGLLELIRDGSLEGGEAEEAFVLAIAQIRDLSDIVQDLLVAARADTGTLHIRPETVDLAQVSVDLVRSLEGHVQTDVHGPVPVLADPVRVRQIVRNLTTNAVRYGGRSQRLIVMPPGVVEVRDDGPPIPDDVRAVMFEAYARTPSSEAPTDSVGLGLTVARTLARLMGGDLTYHHDGTESVFTLSLPGAAG
jgi:signal transduction histidine kinase